jgi:hypothetical protein
MKVCQQCNILGLEVITEKTKYMVMSHHQNAINKNCIHDDIKSR